MITLLYFLLYGGALCAQTIINSASQLIAFSSNVSSGSSYSGTTVLLDSDIDFAKSAGFIQIGTFGDSVFSGVFDGQGHVIKNLALKSTKYQATGLFGIVDSVTIKNVVIDYTCSIVSSYVSDEFNPFTGSIVGRCDSSNGPCTIENCVNMASVSYGEDSYVSTFAGGLLVIFLRQTTQISSITVRTWRA